MYQKQEINPVLDASILMSWSVVKGFSFYYITKLQSANYGLLVYKDLNINSCIFYLTTDHLRVETLLSLVLIVAIDLSNYIWLKRYTEVTEMQRSFLCYSILV